MPEGQVFGSSAQDAAAAIAIEDPGLLSGSDCPAKSTHRARTLSGLSAWRVVQVLLALRAAHGGLAADVDDHSVCGAAAAACLPGSMRSWATNPVERRDLGLQLAWLRRLKIERQLVPVGWSWFGISHHAMASFYQSNVKTNYIRLVSQSLREVACGPTLAGRGPSTMALPTHLRRCP